MIKRAISRDSTVHFCRYIRLRVFAIIHKTTLCSNNRCKDIGPQDLIRNLSNIKWSKTEMQAHRFQLKFININITVKSTEDDSYFPIMPVSLLWLLNPFSRICVSLKITAPNLCLILQLCWADLTVFGRERIR